MRALYIDPGVHRMACARFDDARLASVYFLKPVEFLTVDLGALDRLVVEWPEVYQSTGHKKANDLIELGGAARFVEAAILARSSVPVLRVTPRAWKGQIKKPPHHWRIWHSLTAEERVIAARAFGASVEDVRSKIQSACERLARTGKESGYRWAAHNLLDAIGLGLWDSKRVGRAGHRLTSIVKL